MIVTSTYRKFLIVDDVTDSRALLVRTLRRKFPTAHIKECQESTTAVAASGEERFDVILAHRSVDLDGITLVRVLRKVNPDVPIIMISGIDRTKQALEAGATCFHNYDEWLRIGTVVAQILLPGSSGSTPTPFSNKDPDGYATPAAK